MVENNTNNNQGINPGVYNNEYFSGAQVSLYIGDVWVDEVTSIEYSVSQSRIPLYGYADQLFRGVAEGQVQVRGRFSINFKEAGYLWLILNRYRQQTKGSSSLISPFNKQGGNSGTADRRNIEQIINNEVSQIEINTALQQLASTSTKSLLYETLPSPIGKKLAEANLRAEDTLTGFSSAPRLGRNTAEDVFEAFEDIVWGKPTKLDLEADATEHRRADDTRLNPFDIYLTYGDFAGDNTVNHTIRRISDVHIIGTSQQVFIDGNPIQEVYDFLARNII